MIPRKLQHLVLVAFILLSSLSFQTISVKASSYDLTTCDRNQYAFTVDTLSATNSTIEYTSQGCYTSALYGEAIKKYNSIVSDTNNVVIRYIKNDDARFESPLQIIKANRAMAYSQNFAYVEGDVSTSALGVQYASTIGIYYDSALTNRYTYIDGKEPLFYYQTDLKTSSSSAIPSNMVAYVEINGAKGYIQLTGIDIIPYIYEEYHVLVPFKVKESASSTTKLYVRSDGITTGIYPAQTKYEVTGRDIDIRIDRATTLDIVNDYAPAPSWLTDGNYYSPDGIHFFTDRTLINPVLNGSTQGLFYNYYNYLSLRTKTTLTASNLDNYLSSQNKPTSVFLNLASNFLSAQETYGMNALLIYAMAIQESGYGTNDISATKFNIFSVNAVDSNTGLAYVFSSVQDAVDKQMGIYLRYYMDTNSSKFFGSNIGNKGAGFNTMYASDPFWSSKIAKYAYMIDKMYNLADTNKYSLALLKPEVSSTLYKDRYLTTNLYSIPSRAINYPVTLTASYNNSYYAHSTSPISNGALVTNATTGLITYDWTNSIAYLNQNQVSLLNTPTNPLTVVTDTDELLLRISDFRWVDESTFYIKGRSVLLNTPMPELSPTSQTLILINKTTNERTEIPLTVLAQTYEYFNGLTYNYAGFEGNIVTSTIDDGNYLIKIKTSYGSTTGEVALFDTSSQPLRPDNIITNGTLNKFVLDNWNSMQFNYIKQSRLTDLSITPNLPTEYISFAKLSSLTIETIDEKVLMNLSGLSYIYKINMGVDNVKTGQLILVPLSDPTQSPILAQLDFTNSGYDPSTNNYDYSYAWYSLSTPLDLTDVPNGLYRMYILLTVDTTTDIYEIRDFAFSTDRNLLSIPTRVINLKFLPAERYSINIEIQ